MQSETTGPLPTQTQAANQSPSSLIPRSSDILAGLQSGDNPLDFIQRNLANANVQPAATPAPVAPVAPPPETPAPAAPPAAPAKDPEPSFGFEEKKEEIAPATPPETPTDDEEVSEDPIKENYLKLRTRTKEQKETIQQLQAREKELAEKVTRYETGEVVPDILKEKEETISKLSYFEKLHNLKMSKEYTDTYVTPINRLAVKLKETFAEYGLPPENLDAAVNHALNTKNKAQLNEFLSDLGFDSVGADEVKK
jgi:hypothetical protein